MDPLSAFTAGFGLVGTGLSLYSGMQEARIAKEEAGVEKQILQSQLDINLKRQQQANVEAKRMQLQNIRNAQMARSMAETSATAQGAQMGSGLQGGLGQISGQEQNQQRDITQNLSIANKIFGDYSQIDAYKMQLSDLGAKMANYQGMGAIGGAVAQSAPALGRIFSTIGGPGGLNLYQ